MLPLTVCQHQSLIQLLFLSFSFLFLELCLFVVQLSFFWQWRHEIRKGRTNLFKKTTKKMTQSETKIFSFPPFVPFRFGFINIIDFLLICRQVRYTFNKFFQEVKLWLRGYALFSVRKVKVEEKYKKKITVQSSKSVKPLALTNNLYNLGSW